MADRTGPLGGFYNQVFGQPLNIIQEDIQQEGANYRAGVAASTARRGQDLAVEQERAQREALRAAGVLWSQIAARHSPGPRVSVGGPAVAHEGSGYDMPSINLVPGSPDLQKALKEFSITPEFFMLGQHGVNFGNLINSLQQNPNALTEYTLAPGAQRYVGDRLVAENENRPPRPYESSVDRTRTEILQRIYESGNSANAQLQELQALVEPMERLGQAFPRGTWQGIAARFGLQLTNQQNRSDLETVNALIDGLTPLQRRGLPGAASDRDMMTFRGRLPSLLNTREGNQEILDFLLAQATSQVRSARAASNAFTSQNPDTTAALAAAQGVRFADVQAEVRAQREARAAQRIEAASGIDVRSIARMTDQQLRTTIVQLRARFPNGIPEAIQRRIRSRAEEIERDMDN